MRGASCGSLPASAYCRAVVVGASGATRVIGAAEGNRCKCRGVGTKADATAHKIRQFIVIVQIWQSPSGLLINAGLAALVV